MSHLRVAVVDDLGINREGTRVVLAHIPGVEVVDILDFADALGRDAWDDVDWVIVDVAHERGDVEQTPAVPLIRAIRAATPRGAPMIVAVTSNPVAYDSPMVRRRLVEADPDVGLVWRLDLDEHLRSATDGSVLDAGLHSLPEMSYPEEIPELGITGETKVEWALQGARDLVAKFRGKGRSDERRAAVERARLAAEAKVEPVKRDGIIPARTDIPGLPQWRRLVEAARLPDAAPSGRERRKGSPG